MRTVYVVTDAPRARPVRARLLAALAVLLLALAYLGHVVVLAAGAVDALLAAALGTRRISVLSRQFAHVARDTWRDDL
ncbi:hypothetical protein ACWEN6_24915 [Sphaerisporangium sp. NPDC004334]